MFFVVDSHTDSVYSAITNSNKGTHMKKYLVTRKYLCEDYVIVEANSIAEAIEIGDSDCGDCGTTVTRTYPTKAKISKEA
jgi:hypothetical protein